MAKRAAKQDDDRQAKAAEEARSHGGLVALMGALPGRGEVLGKRGPSDGHWWFRDEYLTQPPNSWCRLGYVETAELAENLNLVVNGVNLRWYGPATVWRFDPSLVPSATAVDVPVPNWKSIPRYCTCGERLFLITEGRSQCERCRIGTSGPVQLWNTTLTRTEGEPDDWPEIPPPGADLEPEPVKPLEPPAPPPLTAEEVADWVWQQVAPLYGR